MLFITDFKIEDYILCTKWGDLPSDVQERTLHCSVDLMGALILGSQGKQYDTGVKTAKRIGTTGNIPILGREDTFNLLGASIVFSHAANSFDIDDGYNMVKGHPGASFIGGVMAAALEKNCSYSEYLITLSICYETAIRWGLAEQKHYGFLHSTGTYGAFGTAAGVGRLHDLSREQLNNALSIADYHAPLVPVMRAVEYPSMNKDGVPFGSLVGTMAVIETEEGETGKTHLLEMPECREYLDSLGQRFYIRELYFKPFTCCRWAHQPNKACIDLVRENNLTPDQIKHVTVHTFDSAAKLSKAVPHNTDEAQYNIAFPVASAIVHGDVGFNQVKDDAVNDPDTLVMMKKLSFVVDPEMEREFPEKRLAWVEMELVDGRKLRSPVYTASGEHTDPDLNFDWINEKFKRVTAPIIKSEGQTEILKLLTSYSDIPMRDIIGIVNTYLPSAL
jgi:2-methylcitrate dehydratase PrpD